MASNNKSPPLLSNSISEPEKQGPAIVLSLEGEAQDVILELDTPVISGTYRVDKIIERLNWLYKKDKLTEKYDVLE